MKELRLKLKWFLSPLQHHVLPMPSPLVYSTQYCTKLGVFHHNNESKIRAKTIKNNMNKTKQNINASSHLRWYCPLKQNEDISFHQQLMVLSVSRVLMTRRCSVATNLERF